MDYSAANTGLWNSVIQIGLIAIAILGANILRRKIFFIRKTLLPTAVFAGFIMLALRLVGILKIDTELLEMITYHGIALGFIALSLRVAEPGEQKTKNTGLKSGAIIVASYCIQGVAGLIISILLGMTIMPNFFKAAGILLPMGYGQGPGQANNIGSSYEALGFDGGRSFGLAIASAGYICACIVGVFYLNYLKKKGKITNIDTENIDEEIDVDTFQAPGEVPISESLDRLSIQVCMVFGVYLLTYLLTRAITSALTAYAPGVASLLNSLLWGFNFMIGSGLAVAGRAVMKKLRGIKIMKRQYQNNYLLSRISGLAFDVMIVAGITSIELEDLSGKWIPFLLMAVAGAAVTLIHLKYICKKVYGDYYYEGLISMYGMMTGTISSGMLLLREIDPKLETPAANNLVVGSVFAILLGAPILALVSIAPKSFAMTLMVLAILFVYYVILLLIAKGRNKEKIDQS